MENMKVTSTFLRRHALDKDGVRTFYDENGQELFSTTFDTTEAEAAAAFSGATAPVTTSGTATAAATAPDFGDPTAKYASFGSASLRPIGTLIDANVSEPLAGDMVFVPEVKNPFMSLPGGKSTIDEVRKANGEFYVTVESQPGVVYNWTGDLAEAQSSLKLFFEDQPVEA